LASRPNILFLLSDEHSFRCLSSRPASRGGEPCHTPALDSLAARGVSFDAAYSQMPLCTPSRIAMLTGRHSHRCGAWSNSAILDPGLPTFASHLGGHGYATAAVGKMHLGGCLQHAGFAARPYGDFGGPCAHQPDPFTKEKGDPGDPGWAMRSRTFDAGVSQVPEALLQEQVVVRQSLAWLREHCHAQPETPWLLTASFSRPHFPLTSPRRFFDRFYPEGVTRPRIGRTGDSADHPMTTGAIAGFRTDEIDEAEMLRARAAYFACVDQLDEILGDFLHLLERDGLLDNTLVVYSADHGEMAGEHGLFWKNTWHEAAVRVPFIFSTPQQRRGEWGPELVRTPVSLADLFPTLCGVAGVDPPDDLDGVDLSPLLRCAPCPDLEARPGAISEALRPRWGAGTEFRMIRSARHKYVAFRDAPDLAFDLEADPDEQVDLVRRGGHPDLEPLRQALLLDFDFGEVETRCQREVADLAQRYGARVTPQTPNQILRGDGVLVEADAPLYLPHVVSADLAADFADFPGHGAASPPDQSPPDGDHADDDPPVAGSPNGSQGNERTDG